MIDLPLGPRLIGALLSCAAFGLPCLATADGPNAGSAAAGGGPQETSLPLASPWVDNGAWANSPAELTGQTPSGGVAIRSGGFAMVRCPLPALRADRVYRVQFSGTTAGQIEKVVLQVRGMAKPYTLFAEEDLECSGGRLTADMQVKPPAATQPGQFDLFLVITGVGTVDLPSVGLAERGSFLLPDLGGPAAGELLINPGFLLAEGGWCLNDKAQVGTPPALILTAGAKVTQETPVVLKMGRTYRVEVRGEGADAGLSLGLYGNGEKLIRHFSPKLTEGRWSEVFAMQPPPTGALPKSQPSFLTLQSAGGARITRLSLAEVADAGQEPEDKPGAYLRFESAGRKVGRAMEGETLDAVVRVAGVPEGQAVSIRLLDWKKAVAYEEKGKAASLGDGTLGLVLHDLRLPSGWFDAEVWEQGLPDGAAPARLATLPGEIAVLRRAPADAAAPDWVLGCHLPTWATVMGPAGERSWKLAPDADAILKAAKDLGIDSQRMHPPLGTKWWAVEPEKGKWVFPDDQIDAAVSQGVSVLGLLDGTPRYASSAPAAQLDAKEGWPTNWAVFPSKDDAAWRNYAHVMALRYKDRVRTWEVWNEPDSRGFLGINPESSGGATREEVYVGLVKAAAEEVRKVDPRITVVAGAVTAVGKDFLLKAIDLGLLDSCDAISFHGYDQVKSSNRGTLAFAGMVKPLREAMERRGKTVPIWDTESSLGAMPEGRAGMYNAETELKGILSRRAAGISRLYLYNGFRKNDPLHQDFRMLMGYNDRPLPILPMLAANSAILGGASFAANLGDEERGEHVFLFAGPRGKVVAAWTSGEGESIFKAPLDFPSGKIVSQMGAEIGAFHDGQLPLASSVRYFVPDGAKAPSSQ